jgi:putative hydrolase of the HAD superfamily
MRAVLFDLGNTLVAYYAAADFGPVLRGCLRTCVSVLPPEAETDANDLERRALELNVERQDHAVWPLEERLKVLFQGFTPDPATLRRLATAFMQPIFATAVADPQALPVLAALRQRGLRLAIVSNTPWGSAAEDWRTELARHGLLAAVDAAVFCADVGYRKPHPAPIQRALALLDIPAAEAVFVGDDPRWDVAGAQAAGVQPILLAKKSAAITPEGVPTATDLGQILDWVNRQ